MRLIDSDELKRKLQSRHDNGNDDFDKGYNVGLGTAIDLIDCTPTVEEIPQAEWKRDNYGDVFCSNCGVECAYNEEGLYSLGLFCHHCGAEMRKGDES